MKKVYWILIAILAGTLLILLFSYMNRDRMMDQLMERSIRNGDGNTEYLNDRDGIRVFTLGTGSPVPSEVNQTSTAVIAGGHFFLFDIGYGTAREAENLNLPVDNISGVFISHWHSDHFLDLPYLINRTWQLGRNYPLPIYGPQGIDTILSSVDGLLSIENQHRIKHHGPDVMNPKVAGTKGIEIDMRERSSIILFTENDLRVTAFKVCHDPISPAYGYRVDYNGKSVVISGDTKENCPELEKFAQGTDLLIHEAMLKDMVLRAAEVNEELGNSRNVKILTDIVEYHTSPEDIGVLAKKVNVKKLVLNHFAPVPTNIIIRRRYRQAIKKHYKGPLSLAKDGNEYYIE